MWKKHTRIQIPTENQMGKDVEGASTAGAHELRKEFLVFDSVVWSVRAGWLAGVRVRM